MSARPAIDGVLFVCHANICRSPLAEAILRAMAARDEPLADLAIDSCGTHALPGVPPDERSVAVGRAKGIEVTGSSRRWNPFEDPARFGLIVAMDRANRALLLETGAPVRRVRLLGDFAPGGSGIDVADPYAGGTASHFEALHARLEAGCAAILEAVRTGRPP